MTFTLLVVVSTSQPGVFVMTAYRPHVQPGGVWHKALVDGSVSLWRPLALEPSAVFCVSDLHEKGFLLNHSLWTAGMDLIVLLLGGGGLQGGLMNCHP